MPSIRKIELKDGYSYEIRVSRGRSKPPVSTRWRPQPGWCRRTEKAELARFAADFERKVKDGEAVRSSEKITARTFAETVFLPLKEQTCKPATLVSYQQALRLHILPAIGDVAMRDVTPAMLQPLALGAPATTVPVLTGLFRLAYQQEVITTNPMDRVQRPRKQKRPEVEALSPEELARLKDCLEGEPLLWRAVLTFLLHTGVRRGELCALRWCDVNLRKGTASINGSLNRFAGEGLVRGATKTGESRVVLLSPEVVQLLKQLRGEQVLSQWVFCRPDSPEVLSPDNVTVYFERFREKYGFPGLHCHTLRHTFASQALASGADIAAVSRALGHSSPNITLSVYSHAVEQNIRAAFEKAAAAF